jgi:Glyoxalase/Bleomycin resistance protein/Dioxygenase superfamily
MTIFGAPGPGLELYHIGLTVPDLGVAMEQYAATLGFSWATIHESRPEVIVDGERRQAEIAVTYSMQGPPYLELVHERRHARRVRLSRAAGRPARADHSFC